MTAHIVVGLNYGDEGKGSITHHLCADSNKKILVTRYCSGHQAGHTVEYKGKRHIFQSFGSGSFLGAPTFWSRYCTVYPNAFMRELNDLKALAINPVVYFDPLCAVTTIYDVIYNQALEVSRGENKHGSVGHGISATFERMETTPYKLYMKDLYYPSVLAIKLEQIKKYYESKIDISGLEKRFENEYLYAVHQMTQNPYFKIAVEDEVYDNMGFVNHVFEGAQGVLLDRYYGFFPYVTRAYTTARNAVEIIKRNSALNDNEVHMQYISRIYVTRHGRGPFPTEGKTEHLIDGLTDTTNIYNQWQENLRYGCLDFELLKYAIECIEVFYFDETTLNQDLVSKEFINFTCLDHLKDRNKILVKECDGTYETMSFENVLSRVAEITSIHKFKTCDNTQSIFLDY
jgi:adenylosuccinate synthase